MRFELQDMPSEVIVYGDVDGGGDKVNISALSVRFGKHLIETSCARQSVIALPGYYAMTRAGAEGLMCNSFWNRSG